MLPTENRYVLRVLLGLLGETAEHSDNNHMTVHNLAVCFAPSLFDEIINPERQSTFVVDNCGSKGSKGWKNFEMKNIKVLGRGVRLG